MTIEPRPPLGTTSDADANDGNAAGGAPLAVFVHVPKTAGSTVNAHLGAWTAAGATHCEQLVDRPAELAQRLPGLAWISGHVPVDRLQTLLRARTGRRLRFFSALREPTAQIASHYNWLIEIFHRGGRFYDGHPEHIRRISAHVRATDNSDPVAVAANLEAYAGLFLNQQSRFVLGAQFDWASGQAAERLLAYEGIATEAGIGALVRQITGAEPAAPRRENESRYHFDRAVFDAPELRRFLLRRHFFDFALHDAAMRVNDARGR